MPEYFSEKINLSILLAPVATTTNFAIDSVRAAAPHVYEIQATILALG